MLCICRLMIVLRVSGLGFRACGYDIMTGLRVSGLGFRACGYDSITGLRVDKGVR